MDTLGSNSLMNMNVNQQMKHNSNPNNNPADRNRWRRRLAAYFSIKAPNKTMADVEQALQYFSMSGNGGWKEMFAAAVGKYGGVDQATLAVAEKRQDRFDLLQYYFNDVAQQPRSDEEIRALQDDWVHNGMSFEDGFNGIQRECGVPHRVPTDDVEQMMLMGTNNSYGPMQNSVYYNTVNVGAANDGGLSTFGGGGTTYGQQSTFRGMSTGGFDGNAAVPIGAGMMSLHDGYSVNGNTFAESYGGGKTGGGGFSIPTAPPSFAGTATGGASSPLRGGTSFSPLSTDATTESPAWRNLNRL